MIRAGKRRLRFLATWLHHQRYIHRRRLDSTVTPPPKQKKTAAEINSSITESGCLNENLTDVVEDPPGLEAEVWAQETLELTDIMDPLLAPRRRCGPK